MRENFPLLFDRPVSKQADMGLIEEVYSVRVGSPRCFLGDEIS